MKQLSTEQLEQIKQSVDIVDIIDQFVALKKRGKNHFGYCPFHDERTPSFTVSQEKQLYKCFSCGRAGNVFSFDGKGWIDVYSICEKSHRFGTITDSYR